MDRSIGLLVIVAGVFIIVIGLLIYSGALSWFGRLPGDIRYERDGVRVYIPIVSMLRKDRNSSTAHKRGVR